MVARLIKTSSKKYLDEADIPVSSDESVVSNVVQNGGEPIDTSDDEDDAPEAVSMSTSKSEIISQIKSEREARRIDREKKRQRSINFQIQNRKDRERKNVEEDEDEDEDIEEQDKNASQTLAPLPENILESAINQKQQQQQKLKQIRFQSSDESDSENLPIDQSEIDETIRLHRAKANKRRLIDTLPYSVVEVGVNGQARISKAEIKARRNISKSKLERAGSQVRRIDAVLDRARKNRSASAVFYRNNSFY